MNITCCLICQDEEQTIINALNNVYIWVDEIVILDGGSKDRTVEVIKNYSKLWAETKIKLFEYPFEYHFADQKNRALEKTTGDWILWMDCDEIFEEDLLSHLKLLVEKSAEEGWDAYSFIRKTRIDGWLHNHFDFDFQIRFWKNFIGIRYVGRLHESPAGFSKLQKCNLIINHNKSQEQQQKDNETYWNMGQNPPEGWTKTDGKWSYSKN